MLQYTYSIIGVLIESVQVSRDYTVNILVARDYGKAYSTKMCKQIFLKRIVSSWVFNSSPRELWNCITSVYLIQCMTNFDNCSSVSNVCINSFKNFEGHTIVECVVLTGLLQLFIRIFGIYTNIFFFKYHYYIDDIFDNGPHMNFHSRYYYTCAIIGMLLVHYFPFYYPDDQGKYFYIWHTYDNFVNLQQTSWMKNQKRRKPCVFEPRKEYFNKLI